MGLEAEGSDGANRWAQSGRT